MADEKYEIHAAAREGRRELPLVVSVVFALEMDLARLSMTDI